MNAHLGEFSMTEQEVRRRGIRRLCHLTPVRNLVHIATGQGLESTASLEASERSVFNQQDLARLDQHSDHISCSIEYPNVWYLRQRLHDAGHEGQLFPDWACICLDPHLIWAESTLFCPRNAAAEGGRLVEAGFAAFQGLYAESVLGAHSEVFQRTSTRPRACPTDDQAEVLVYRHVSLEDVQGLVLADPDQAGRVHAGLIQLGVPGGRFRYSVCSEFFSAPKLSRMLRTGRPPQETAWIPWDVDDE